MDQELRQKVISASRGNSPLRHVLEAFGDRIYGAPSDAPGLAELNERLARIEALIDEPQSEPEPEATADASGQTDQAQVVYNSAGVPWKTEATAKRYGPPGEVVEVEGGWGIIPSGA